MDRAVCSAVFGLLAFAEDAVAGVGHQQQGLRVVVHLLTQRSVSICAYFDYKIVGLALQCSKITPCSIALTNADLSDVTSNLRRILHR